MEKTITNKQSLFQYVTVAATKIFCKRRIVIVLSHFPARFAFSAASAILLVPSLFTIRNNESALRRNSKTISSINIWHTRDRFEVFITMLEAAVSGGIKKSEILYGAYLDPRDFNAHLQLLIQNRLLIKEEYNGKDNSKDNSNCYYRITNRGFMFLELYRELERLFPSLRIYVNN
jgi:predicted transcriptional regulator